MILKTNRIYKDEKEGEESLPRKSLDEIIVKYRVPLSKVRGWEEDFKTKSDYWKNKEEKVYIYFDDNSYSIVLMKLGDFDKMMEEFLMKDYTSKFN